ncbi:MAG: hypothetical protein JWO09_1014 [Bacteroidetes bacterium]|nr:hypothetical protein [Bacteroidota bacterium]
MVSSSGALHPSTAGSLRFYEAGFTGTSPVFVPRTLGASVNSISSAGVNETLNSATDSAGNILFYVFANCTSAYSGSTSDNTYFVAPDPVTGNDEVFAVLLPAGTGASSAKDLNIIKKDGAFNEYYVIYKTSCINTYAVDEIRYVTVNMNTRTISAPTTLLSGSLNEGMAVSVKNCSLNNRWFFFVKYVSGNLNVYRSSITSAGISAPTMIYTISIPGNSSLGQGDIEISPVSDRIAFVNYTSGSVNKDIVIFDFDLSTGALSNERWINNSLNYIIEVEFSPDGQRLYAFRGGTSAITAELYNVQVPAAGVNYTMTAADKLSVPIAIGHTLEMAYNGYLYFAPSTYNTQLRYISNPNANAATNIVGATAASSFGPGNAVTFTLPEQIDGENISAPASGSVSVAATADTICAGQPVTLTATGGSGYTWSNTDTASVITVSPLATTTYYVTGLGACGTDSDTITIQVDSPVNVSVSAGDDSICSGQSTVLSASGSAVYQWSGGSSSTAASITVNPVTTTAYYVSGTLNACPVDTDTITVFVETTPSITISGSSLLCAGQSTTLTASGGLSYTWSGGATASTAGITVSPAVTTTYYAGSSSVGCGSDTDTITVIVDTLVSISVTASNDSICSGQSVNLSASGSSTYQWSGGSSSTAAALTVSPAASTTYYVTGSVNACGSDTDTLAIFVQAIPVVSIAGTDSLCEGQSVTLTAGSAAAYQWSGGSSATTSAITVSPAVTTEYIVTGYNGSCSAVDSVTVRVDTLPVLSISGTSILCAGQSSTLTASGAASYIWSGAITSSASSVTVSPSSTTTYSVTGSNGACSAAVTYTVQVNPVPAVNITGPTLICAGSTAGYSANASGGTSPYNYLWLNGDSTPSISINPSAVNTLVGVLLTDVNGCTDTASLTLVSVPLPSAILSGNASGCGPLSVSFLNESTNAASYLWDFGDGSTSTLQDPVHVYADSGSYNVTLITTNAAGCSDTLLAGSYVTVFPSPVAAITTTGNVDSEHPVLTVFNGSQDGSSCFLYYGDGAVDAGCSWTDITHVYENEGVYTITQIVTSANGCSDTAETTISVIFETTFFAPNAFTPNGSGNNDVFMIKGVGLNEFRLSVYDRWGEKIFESNDILKGWDGTYKGRLVEQDVYVWKADFTTRRQGKQQRIGRVTVVK